MISKAKQYTTFNVSLSLTEQPHGRVPVNTSGFSLIGCQSIIMQRNDTSDGI